MEKMHIKSKDSERRFQADLAILQDRVDKNVKLHRKNNILGNIAYRLSTGRYVNKMMQNYGDILHSSSQEDFTRREARGKTLADMRNQYIGRIGFISDEAYRAGQEGRKSEQNNEIK